MPLSPTRTIRVFRYAVFFDGIDDRAVIAPFTVYGWSEITIEEYLYIHHPKVNLAWSRSIYFGDEWVDKPAFTIYTNPPTSYTILEVGWIVRRPDGSRGNYIYSLFAWRNRWFHLITRFTSTRELSYYINASRVYYVTIPSNEKTILEWNPNTSTYPELYRRFILGANTWFSEHMKLTQSYLRIYSRALSDSEITHNYRYYWSPVRDGLKVWLVTHPDYIKDIDGDGVLEWIDLSGNNNHAKLYGATLVELIKPPSR